MLTGYHRSSRSGPNLGPGGAAGELRLRPPMTDEVNFSIAFATGPIGGPSAGKQGAKIVRYPSLTQTCSSQPHDTNPPYLSRRPSAVGRERTRQRQWAYTRVTLTEVVQASSQTASECEMDALSTLSRQGWLGIKLPGPRLPIPRLVSPPSPAA
ncbi:hypothetical protein CPLU01_05896 [Colletotrichum plurivorum]|uniref:Uncharacterized protein n=1 Tax=Colletotrichum plurivorum TaxID=2175906 RepID=A0A8H6KK12_9PEZI|nr:hypothetical protein CPLU01_05896 [Colletotrichum plurivorum]